jgi:nucleolar complex protein 3
MRLEKKFDDCNTPPPSPLPPPSMSSITRFAAASNWDLEQSYEQGPRSLKRKKKDKKENTRLPIKTAHGIVQQVEAPPSPEETETEDEDDRQKGAEWTGFAEKEDVKKEEKPRIPERQRVLEAKEELARLASALNEDPEENVCRSLSARFYENGRLI